MALRAWGITEALTTARDNYFLVRAVDQTLTAPDRALCQEMADSCDRALNALNPDDTMPVGQRNPRFTDIRDHVYSLTNVNHVHGFNDPEYIYNGCDLALDAAYAILAGQPTFLSNLGPGL